MIWNHMRYIGLLVLAVLFSVPAVAQFEVSPDHFDDPPATPAQTSAAQKEHVRLQMASAQAELKKCHKQIENKAAEVEQARQLLLSPAGSADEAGESFALAARERELKQLKTSLAAPIHEAELRIAKLQRDQNAAAPPPATVATSARKSGPRNAASPRTVSLEQK
jgi:hypothetical protein